MLNLLTMEAEVLVETLDVPFYDTEVEALLNSEDKNVTTRTTKPCKVIPLKEWKEAIARNEKQWNKKGNSRVLSGATEQGKINDLKRWYSFEAEQAEKKALAKGSFNSVFPNQQYFLMEYLLEKMKTDGLITPNEAEKASKLHSIARSLMGRQEYKKGSSDYLACFVTNESLKKLGFKSGKVVSNTLGILEKIGFARAVTVKGEQRYIYPMLTRLNNAEYLPNVTVEEAYKYFFPKKELN